MIFLLSPRSVSWAFIFLLIISFSTAAQQKTNLEVFKFLIDSSFSEIFVEKNDSIPNVIVTLNLGTSFGIFENHIYHAIQSQNKKIIPLRTSASFCELNYVLENASVEYGEVFRDGLLGDHFLSRKISVTGNYRLGGEYTILKDFALSNLDTVKFNEVQFLENSSYPFSQGKIPAEPFFSNLFEPLVAITTAAAVIVLFFTVRSK